MMNNKSAFPGSWASVFGTIFLVSQLMTGLGCAEVSGERGMDGHPGTFAEKTPRMPTLFVDTTGKDYRWHKAYNPVQSIRNRIRPPEGYQRKPAAKGSFAHWLRMLPLKPGRPEVMLYNGQPKGNQDAQYAVVDIDVGNKDLQQCADAVMRLRAEYLLATGQTDQIHFNYTSGDRCDWTRYAGGERLEVRGSQVRWVSGGAPDDSYENFRRYLRQVFTYAGTASLSRELLTRHNQVEVEPGDVFIQGGFPGHAVIVVDVAHPDQGPPAIMLAQSYMPAQDIHVLRNPVDDGLSPWFVLGTTDRLYTPEWTFDWADLRSW